MCHNKGRPSSYSTGDLTGKGEERALFQLRGKAMQVSTRVCLEIIKRVLTSSQFCQTLILITHDRDIAQLADRIVHIEDGKIVGDTRKGSDSYA